MNRLCAVSVRRPAPNRRAFLAALASLPFSRLATAQPRTNPRFHVLSLFHPSRLLVHAIDAPLPVLLNHESQTLVRNAALTLDTGDTLRLSTPATFALEVPGKLRRAYTGALSIDTTNTQLRAVVTLDRELAVATIVTAESPNSAHPDSLAAQAIASRSFLLGAHTTHPAADFCDTTHCQFLADPPSPAALAATRRTAGLALQFRDPAAGTLSPIAALYSRRCGGRTRTLRELGLPTRNGYPFYAVDCPFCRAHPDRWTRELPAAAPRTERARLDYNRIHGWAALPSPPDPGLDLSTPALSTTQGRGTGHGIGLCQLGAAHLAARGLTFAQILMHYYPNTLLAPAP